MRQAIISNVARNLGLLTVTRLQHPASVVASGLPTRMTRRASSPGKRLSRLSSNSSAKPDAGLFNIIRHVLSSGQSNH